MLYVKVFKKIFGLKSNEPTIEALHKPPLETLLYATDTDRRKKGSEGETKLQ